ncbi:hypothetical protein BVRB_6g130480 [Beta vulgaris subsp. vulgaris]|nr:hypothetical protein BVRB_6g130480 [Beta vulgaris subsp. vulgaris]
MEEGRSLTETPTWAVATVISLMVASVFLFTKSVESFGQGYESFASYESLEQLHRLLFVLGVTHVTYSSLAIALSVIKIYSWRIWEDEAKLLASQTSSLETSSQDQTKLKRLSTFVAHHASHPWSQHKVLVWLLCFSRQFWSSINKFDYTALRFGFLTTHQLPLSYDFLNYMLRSMDEEFRDIVGISLPLWIYAIFCIFLDFHGTHLYFWLSFAPATIIIIIGTKLHRVVVKLAVEIMDSHSHVKTQEFKVKLRDELFWFGKPRLLLWFIQFISFQNAFEMAMFLWSLWEINGTSCFMDNKSFIAIRLTFGLISQVWCSYITFPLYVIITEMGSKFKKAVIPEGVRKSLHGWKKRVKTRQNNNPNNVRLTSTTSMPLIRDVGQDDFNNNGSNNDIINIGGGTSWRNGGSRRRLSLVEYGEIRELFTPRQPHLVDTGRVYYDSDTSSDNYYEEDEEDEEEEEEEEEDRDDVHYVSYP